MYMENDHAVRWHEACFTIHGAPLPDTSGNTQTVPGMTGGRASEKSSLPSRGVSCDSTDGDVHRSWLGPRSDEAARRRGTRRCDSRLRLLRIIWCSKSLRRIGAATFQSAICSTVAHHRPSVAFQRHGHPVPTSIVFFPGRNAISNRDTGELGIQQGPCSEFCRESRLEPGNSALTHRPYHPPLNDWGSLSLSSLPL